jgi:hypothetical protein
VFSRIDVLRGTHTEAKITPTPDKSRHLVLQRFHFSGSVNKALAKWRFCCPVGSIAVSCSPVEHEFTCPYCGEEISMVLDLSVGRQTYIEDCEVCCKPIEVSFTVEEDELASFSAKTLG